MEGDPATDSNANRGDFFFSLTVNAKSWHPDANTSAADFAANGKTGERVDHPGLKALNEGADVTAMAAQIEHRVDHALAGAVIRELTTAPRFVDGETGCIDKVGFAGTGAGGVQGGMLKEPDEFAGVASGNGSGAVLHQLDGGVVSDRLTADRPSYWCW